MERSELNYLSRRAEEETERATYSSDPVAAGVHRRLAELYSEQVAAGRQRPVLKIVSPTAGS